LLKQQGLQPYLFSIYIYIYRYLSSVESTTNNRIYRIHEFCPLKKRTWIDPGESPEPCSLADQHPGLSEIWMDKDIQPQFGWILVEIGMKLDGSWMNWMDFG
jgi:hypothetical protein